MTQQLMGETRNAEWFQLIMGPSGYGLCLFFVLSSYLITEILIREREYTGTVHLRAFYVRRILRIWPLYICFLPFGYLFGKVFADFAVRKIFVLQYAFLLVNYAFYHNPVGNPIGPLWSISIEEQFYLCWPFVALKFGGKGLTILSLLTLAASLVSSSWLTSHALHPGFAIWTNSMAQFGCFAAGALLSLSLHGRVWNPGIIRRSVLLIMGLASWIVSDGVLHFKRGEMLANRSRLSHVVGFQLIIAGCCFLFLSLLFLPIGRWAKPLIYMGRVSYGLYVFHILALIAVKELALQLSAGKKVDGRIVTLSIMLLSLSLSCVCATLSYEHFEKHFLTFKKRFSFVRT